MLLTRHHHKKILSSLTALCLSACAQGPNYQKPKMDLPTAFKEQASSLPGAKVAQPSEVQSGQWWRVYQDTRLDGLMAQLETSNQSLKIAEAQYRQAEALLKQAQSALWPSLTLNASDTHSEQGGKSSRALSLTTAASWEVDVWGRVRRSVEAGTAKAEGARAQWAAARLSQEALLASTYLSLIVADQQISQLKQSVLALSETYRLTQNQTAVGIGTQADVAQSLSQLRSAEVSLTDKILARKQLEHALAVLLGKSAAEVSLASDLTSPNLPQIPAGLPATLLERRPDISAAERAVAQANANIGVAQAAFFPALTLGGSAGYKSGAYSSWFDAPARYWSLAPNLAMTLFDAGNKGAIKSQAVASYDQSVAQYRLTVLQAVQTVEDNLAAQTDLAIEARLQSEALSKAREAETIALNQYKAGTVTFTTVSTAQNARIAAEKTWWDIRNRQYAASVALITALGGTY